MAARLQPGAARSLPGDVNLATSQFRCSIEEPLRTGVHWLAWPQDGAAVLMLFPDMRTAASTCDPVCAPRRDRHNQSEAWGRPAQPGTPPMFLGIRRCAARTTTGRLQQNPMWAPLLGCQSGAWWARRRGRSVHTPPRIAARPPARQSVPTARSGRHLPTAVGSGGHRCDSRRTCRQVSRPSPRPWSRTPVRRMPPPSPRPRNDTTGLTTPQAVSAYHRGAHIRPDGPFTRAASKMGSTHVNLVRGRIRPSDGVV